MARRAMARDFMAHAISSLAASELSLLQMASLLLLDDGVERGVKEMAGRLGRSLSATSRLLEQLVKRGLVTRREDPEDRRARRVALSPAGRELLAALIERRAEAQLQLMEALTPEEREHVARGMTLLAEAARRKTDGR